MARLTVKLLLVDPDDRLLLIHGRDPADGTHFWYPVGGGIEAGETHQEAAAREAWEETGIEDLPVGEAVWTRSARYRFAGASQDVHETWLLHHVAPFEPAPALPSAAEQEGIAGFRWWTVDDLRATTDTVFPSDLGQRWARLLDDGSPATPVDITSSPTAR